MNKLNHFIEYIGKTGKELASLAKVTHCNRIFHWIDYLWSLVRHGAHIRQYTIGEFWRFSGAERKRRMTYGRMCRLMKNLGSEEFVPVLKNKSEFNRYFKDFVKRDWIDASKVGFDEFKRFVVDHSQVIVKPVGGIMGKGVEKFTFDENTTDNQLEMLYKESASDGSLIEERITPHPQMIFGNTSVNTIRVYTVVGKDKKGHVIKTILRAGVGDTAADNFHMGGSIYEVDVETGIVTTLGQSKSRTPHIKHPGTDIIMLGYQVPRWNEVISLGEKAAEHLPQIGIVGWDIAIMPDGVQLIEGNHNPDYELLEYIGTSGYYVKIKNILK